MSICIMAEEIPQDELEKFSDFVKIYKKGELLISEGAHDTTLYMLRKGIVGVYRKVDGADSEMLITFIGAVNFIGEMELITGGPRISTVRAFSDEVMVYAFENPDYVTMLCNKEWGLKLLLRLSSDLKFFSDKAVELETEIFQLRRKIQELQGQSL